MPNNLEPDEEAAASPYRNKNVVGRIALTGMLMLGLLGALRWASDITNANAKQVSRNLTEIRSSMDTPVNPQTNFEPRRQSKNKKRRTAKPDAP